MKAYLEAEKQDSRRRRRERVIIVCLLFLIPVIAYLGIKVLDLGLDLPIANSILVFALIDINVILLLLLLYLTLRNLVKLVFERRKKIMGAKLRTRLVLAFITLSLLPTIILFFVSVQFISTSVEYWFNIPVERSLRNSLEVGQSVYSRVVDELLFHGNTLGRLISYHGYTPVSRNEEVDKLINEKRVEYQLASVQVFSQNMQQRAVSQDEKLDLSPFKGPGADILRKSFEKGSDAHEIQTSSHGQLVSGIVPIFSRTESKAVVGLVVTQKLIPGDLVNRLNELPRGLEEFKQLKLLKRPIKTIHLITLSIVTLLIIFASVWFGLYLSKGITIPIQELAEGTHRIASGDYDFFIDLQAKDEIGVLVNSFNQMTMDLKNSKMQLEETNRELIRSNVELEQRRLNMEIVFSNVAAGVISTDADGSILTFNRSAEKMLDLRAKNVLGRHYEDVLKRDHLIIINEFFQDRSLLRKGSLKRQISLTVGTRVLPLLVSLNVLRDDKGKSLGVVGVLEDLSEIEKAQRMAAWREVARRIAHEVKNPLTPIQLSAQRLKRRYAATLAKEEHKVFEECTDMIIDQVEELKRLVNEFSSYARLPAPNLSPNSIKQIIQESVNVYKEAQKGVAIAFHDAAEGPEIKVDREQMKRVMINLLDNALDAMDGKGRITIDLSYDQDQQIVTIEVADNGKGIPPEHKARVFEPYFSTKKHGTGLGLAIVNNIINDHNGSIRVQDEDPQGTRFIIELPMMV